MLPNCLVFGASKDRRRGRASSQSRVKRVIMKTAETKYKIGYAENVALYHDRGASSAGLLTSNQGAIVFNPWFAN